MAHDVGKNDVRLYQGQANPKDIVLRDLEATAAATGTTIYLRTLDANPKDVVLYNPAESPSSGVVTHTTTGALVGVSSVVGSANRLVIHSTIGVLAGQGSSLAGTSAHALLHANTGVLIGQGSAVSGVAARSVTHASSGALQGAGTVLAGVGVHPHASVGVLSSQGAIVAGVSSVSAGSVAHDTSGALAGSEAVISGLSSVNVSHAASGDLVGLGSLLEGLAVGPGSASYSQEVELNLADLKPRPKPQHVEIAELAEKLEQVEEQKVELETEIRAARKKKNVAKIKTQEYDELKTYIYLLSLELNALTVDLSGLQEQIRAMQAIEDRLAWQQSINEQNMLELDMAFVMAMMAEA